ncbi:AfsR/SARP family transcriptional regulator [Streptomyces sioyaensis]|uniref:OmpR/PhoB-type domain-containing protein n=1 Tax=Streptomyces sioyaensis TaxID=67364 RepID=A0A4Q1QSM3_9ACTN|nr:AfsR/SARP family transcriptional regulator [Streptomyces sioyaensis]MBM4792837.1 AfsR/SARP family transcriptional regulator [Streptomyces sioyaensis]RXS65125.1 hypothetical protein EST54_19735 [Streptomyces sioyaensis]
MEFSVLGSFAMRDGGKSYLPSAPKTRQLLALFVLHSNEPVSLATCLEELWGNRVPRSAVQSLHTRVLHIRRALAGSVSVGSQEKAKQLLVTQHRGHLLRVAPGSLDLHELDRHVQESRRAQKAGDDLGVSSALRSALSMWRGTALSDIHAGPILQARVNGLEEFRLTLLEQCIEAELRLGMHHDLVSELGRLVAEHSAHENFHAQYMLALYRSGRAAQALDTYHALRETLNDELGIEPTPKLRELQTAILTANPILNVSPPQGRGLSLDLFSSC